MEAGEFGRKLGIGVRIAGKIARQRAEQKAQTERSLSERAPSQPPQPPTINGNGAAAFRPAPPPASYVDISRDLNRRANGITRAAGRGVGGFLRPFTRIGGILFLEVTGFFFGLIALYFAFDLWRIRLAYRSGPDHTHFLIAASMTAVFCYLCISSFWRVRKK